MLKIIESTSIGNQVIKERQAIVLGISINNSYFKESNLEKLIMWATVQSKSVYIMIPDVPSVYTLMAIGYERNKAEKIARLKSNNLENKCLGLIEHLGIENIKIIRWKDFMSNTNYLQSLAEITKTYDLDLRFKEVIRNTTKDVISKKIVGGVLESEIDTGCMFLLQELAFISRSNLILGEDKTAYAYHTTMQVLKDILEFKYSFIPAKVGLLTVH